MNTLAKQIEGLNKELNQQVSVDLLDIETMIYTMSTK